MIKTRHLILLPVLLLCAAGVFGAPHHAHATAAVVTKAEEATSPDSAPPVFIDPIGRSSPRGLVTGFLDSLSKEDFEKAGQYLNLSQMPQSGRKEDGARFARDLQTLLDNGGWFYPSSLLSNHPDGNKDEKDVGDDRDIIGTLRGPDKRTIDIVAQKTTDKEGNPIWLISPDTMAQIPTLVRKADETVPLINKILPDILIESKWFGAPAGHWIAVLFLFALSYASVWFITLGAFAFLKKIWTKKCSVAGHHLLDEVRLPVSLYVAVWVFAYSSLWAGLSIIVRQQMSQLNVIVAWTAVALLIWRLIDIFTEVAQKKVVANGRFFGFSSILFFVRRMVKILFGVVVLIIILANLGVDVTAGLAALGIGGIALALGAQKTLENFIGSLSIVIDQPLHIGDYCKIGETAGTIEDIGMRSTRLRTNERTLITIPNGDLSNQRIENMARRTRFLVHKKFQLRYDATSEQLRLFLKKSEELFFASEYVTEEGMPIRYLGPGSDGHLIELFFYINVSDNNEYLKIQQGLMLQMVDLVSELGLYYIIPSQTMLPAVDQRGAVAKVAAAPRHVAAPAKAGE